MDKHTWPLVNDTYMFRKKMFYKGIHGCLQIARNCQICYVAHKYDHNFQSNIFKVISWLGTSEVHRNNTEWLTNLNSVATKFKNLDTLVLKSVLWVLFKIAVLKPNQVSTPTPLYKRCPCEYCWLREKQPHLLASHIRHDMVTLLQRYSHRTFWRSRKSWIQLCAVLIIMHSS